MTSMPRRWLLVVESASSSDDGDYFYKLWLSELDNNQRGPARLLRTVDDLYDALIAHHGPSGTLAEVQNNRIEAAE